MKDKIAKILSQAAELHHQVYAAVDGSDPEWASWYADWLINVSALPELLKVKPVRSELVYLLVKLNKDYEREKTDFPWEQYYAEKMVDYFGQQHEA